MALRPSLAAGLLLSERGLGRLLIVWGGLAQLQGQRAWCDNVSIGNYLFDILVKSRYLPDSRRQRCCSIVVAERCSLNKCGYGWLENHRKYMLADAYRSVTILACLTLLPSSEFSGARSPLLGLAKAASPIS